MGIQTIPAPGAGVTQKVQEFTSTGSFVTPSNVSAVQVILVGGGGGAGFTNNTLSDTSIVMGPGGAGGEYIENLITVTPGTTYTVTVGAGGAASTSASSNGGTGSNTTFGSLATAFGGNGGASYDTGPGTRTIALRGGGGINNSSNVSGGAGGGAGGPASTLNWQGNGTSWQVYNYTAQISPTTRVTNMGIPNGSWASQGLLIAGPGKNGFGNGGAGAFRVRAGSTTTSVASCVYSGTGAPGVWESDGGTRTVAIAPTANTGDGGHGNTTTSTTSSGIAGTAGASGYAKVIYWS